MLVRLRIVGLTLLLSTSAAYAGLFDSGWSEDSRVTRECFAAVDRDPQLDTVNARLVRREPTLRQLADEGVPSERDGQLIGIRAERERTCRDLTLEKVRKHRAPLISAYQVRFFQTDVVYLQLMNRRITFGNANKLLHEAYLSFSSHEDKYLQARNDAQRRAIAESLNQISQQARTPPPPYPSSGRLTCRWVGPTLYCDPY